jgi:flagellar assembly protein FliH
MSGQPPRPVKFNFDNVFGAKTTAAQPAASRTRSSYSSDEVEAIRRETFRQGKADTEAAAAAVKAQALGAIAQSMGAVIAEFDAAVLAMRQESALVALQVGRKLAAVALAFFPEKEVETVVADCLHKLHREPRLVVRVSQACADALKNDIAAMCQTHGYAGRVIIMAEPSLSGADCSVEWADGGIERDLAATFAAIEQSAERWRTSTSAEEA